MVVLGLPVRVVFVITCGDSAELCSDDVFRGAVSGAVAESWREALALGLKSAGARA